MDILKRLALNKYETGNESHIKVNTDICRTCKYKPCTKVCPAGTYEANEKEILTVHYERCLECGAALVACPFGAIEFTFPEKGISYTYG
ncbi:MULTISPECIES: ferredoxin family protein [Acidiplasma]|jgi:ferredoxin like protein|uniref:4Fe-4S ferredoxin n=2 Tax=Acidiplasma TaxID=507753 RepID=A0A0Q0VJG0_9ARCH|nr:MULTISPECIES: 4Fe-4S dicluster domain-containing protein [Acidiplasma]KJE48825.1 4Fe-4S ferredoxin [Acidiplasma sp. MBA-1]KPV47258.1 4Fe-4S ferredoxin [Acidiplasma aeolicum]KQB33641.1 4Fe-4S ferredoxin [Acidiplasma cupricumulans]KQB34421.1 4Fe-4S ferredoxin [Acidiplasma aeolicum]WMT54218.1 MAG: 4Fe-4S dicluster domain-containing protein [Acidiplasma sp.]